MSAPLAILGPGTLGLSTAQWAAECGLETRLLGRTPEHAEAGLREIQRRLDRSVDKGTIAKAIRDLVLARLSAWAFGPGALEGASTLLEGIPEDPTIKSLALASIARWASPELLILSGTSALSIGDLARRAGLEGRLVGFHLFVPVPRMAVVEMAVPAGTEQTWVERAKCLGQALNKRVVQVHDQPGFAAARMALAQGLEAMRLFEAGVASADDLDALMVLGYGHPVGPFELSDRVGLDLRLAIADRLVASGEERFQASELLRTKVAEGLTGSKVGQGFYAWNPQGRRT